VTHAGTQSCKTCSTTCCSAICRLSSLQLCLTIRG
jgi:hypothetical protein